MMILGLFSRKIKYDWGINLGLGHVSLGLQQLQVFLHASDISVVLDLKMQDFTLNGHCCWENEFPIYQTFG